MKKLLAIMLSLFIAFGVTACGEHGSKVPKEEDVKIEVPDAEDITRLPDPVDLPAKPTLPQADPANAPYIGAVHASTDAYAVNKLGADRFEGVEVGYPATGKTLGDYNYLYFDVYNYSPEYSFIRFDFTDVVGAEKVAVSAHYTEGYGELPAVGVLVGALMDGELSFVTDLSDFHTVTKDYTETTEELSVKTVCRLFMYLDTNPSQHPSDKEGSLTISSIRFLKAGDPDTIVDNSPKFGAATAEGTGYTLAETENVFRAEYTPSGLSADAYVNVPVNRFTGGYGRIKLTYAASGVGKLTVTDGANALSGADENGAAVKLDNYAPKSEETVVIDIRGKSALTALRFYIDSKDGAGAGGSAASFEVKSIEMVYTPYVTPEWDSTSKFHLSGAALGGKVKGTYDQDVGYDYMHVPVKYWTPEYTQMTVKFKTSGSMPGDTGAKRYGLSVNSNNVLLEVAYNSISDLPYDDATGVYTLQVNLSAIKKLATLNFFFDSIAVDPFGGNRTVEFLSIEFEKASPELNIGKIQTQNGFTVTNNADGSADVSWAENKEAFYVNSHVSNWDERYSTYSVTVENTGETAANFAVYRGDWSTVWLTYNVIGAGEKRTFTVPVVAGLSDFDLYYFINCDGGLAGSLKISGVKFIKKVGVGSIFDVSSAVEQPKQYNVEKAGNVQKVTWDTKDAWAKVGVRVSGYDPAYKFFKLSFNSEKDVKIGVWMHKDFSDAGGAALSTHTLYEAGDNTVYVPMAAGYTDVDEFMFYIYIDQGVTTAGAVDFTELSFVMEKPEEEVKISSISDANIPAEYTVTKTGTAQTVSWNDGRSQWAKAGMTVSSLKAGEYKWIKVDFTLSRAMSFGIHQADPSGDYWLQTANYEAGRHTVYVIVPVAAAGDFTFHFYFDTLASGTITAGSVTFNEIAFVNENPNA